MWSSVPGGTDTNPVSASILGNALLSSARSAARRRSTVRPRRPEMTAENRFRRRSSADIAKQYHFADSCKRASKTEISRNGVGDRKAHPSGLGAVVDTSYRVVDLGRAPAPFG